MKTKTGGSRARLSKLPSSSLSTLSLPFLIYNPQEVIRGRLSRENSGGGRCGDDTGACGDIMKVDVSAENLDDSDLDKDFMGSDSDSEIKVCTLCGEDGGDDALSCSEVGCPVSFHRGCAPGYNGSGKYFCPYCKYKNATLMKAKLKRKAIEMNNLLSDFLCHMPSVRDNVKMDDRGGEEWELNVSRHLSENGVSNVLKQRRVEEKNSLEVAGTENVMEPTSVRLGHWTSKGEKKVQAQNIHEHVHECGEEVHAEENNIMDGSDERIDVVKSIQRSEEEQNLSGGIISSDYDNKALSVDKRHLPSKGKQKLKTVNVAEEENSLSEGGTISSDYDSDIDNKPLSVRKKHLPSRGELKLPAKNGGTSKKLSSSKDKNTSFRNASMPAQIKSIKQPPATHTNLPFGNEKRKRKDWETEEEEMLREAVKKFSNTVKKNLPWRKIFDFGRHVFHPTRQPTDLKDKWKNMKGKGHHQT